MSIKCPECRFDNPDSTRFCGNCGAPLCSSDELPTSPTKTLVTPLRELTRGTTFAHWYEIIEELGKGGMAKVYRVYDTTIEEEQVSKCLRAAYGSRDLRPFGHEKGSPGYYRKGHY